MCIRDRYHAENECHRRHDNRTKPELRRLDRRFQQRMAFLEPFVRKFHDENRVFRRESDQCHESDLEVDIVGHALEPNGAERAEETDRHLSLIHI